MTIDSGYYEGARRGINDQYAAQMAANTYSKSLSQTRGKRSLSEMQTGFKRSIPGFTSQWGQRGLGGGGIKSGVMQQAMGNYLGDYTRNYGYAQNDFAESCASSISTPASTVLNSRARWPISSSARIMRSPSRRRTSPLYVPSWEVCDAWWMGAAKAATERPRTTKLQCQLGRSGRTLDRGVLPPARTPRTASGTVRWLRSGGSSVPGRSAPPRAPATPGYPGGGRGGGTAAVAVAVAVE